LAPCTQEHLKEDRTHAGALDLEAAVPVWKEGEEKRGCGGRGGWRGERDGDGEMRGQRI
jgi:hypothetical protein